LTTPVLKVKDLKTVFRNGGKDVAVVNGIDFTVNEGEIVGIVGESGCGKSMTSLSIMGLVPSPHGRVSEGSIRFMDRDLLEMKESEMRKIRGGEIAMIFQEPMTSLNPAYTIGRQIDEMILLHQDVSKKEARKRTIELLKRVSIPRAEEIVNEYPHQLSGGMRQRVMIAMAMACNPKLLIADEPTTALDVTIQAQILDLMRNLQKETGSSIILITHDLGIVAETCQRVIVMYAGQIVEEGSVIEIFKNPTHPYTKGLLNSIPKIHEQRDILDTIPGSLPSPDEIPDGCRFATRCAVVQEACWKEQPALRAVHEEAGHRCRCLLVG
jgi:peptide/nickel transport system ATP-binding protein